MDGDALMRSRTVRDDRGEASIDGATLEEWALSYLGRYASTAENLRLVLRRRVRRRLRDDDEGAAAARTLIDELVTRYCAAKLVDDAGYAAGRVRRDVARGRSLRRIAAGLAAKGVGASDAAAAIATLHDDAADPDLAAACAFARRRRFGPFRTGEADRQRELAAFARAGFSRRVAEAVLACADETEVLALLAGDSE